MERVINMKKISSFRGKNRFLSNFYECPVGFEGLTYPSAEAAFQACKCSKEEDKIKYTKVKDPAKAKQMGKRETLPEDWDMMSYGRMYDVLSAKFSDPELAAMLKATGEAYLEEGNHWHDNNWGNCNCDSCRNIHGHNSLGNILMEIRDDLKGDGHEYIRDLYCATEGGELTITYIPSNGEPPCTYTYGADWTNEDADIMVQKYDKLEAHLKKIGQLYADLEDEANRISLLTEEELETWNIYIRPYDTFDVDTDLLFELYQRWEGDDTLDDEEYEILERHYAWKDEQSQKRLPVKYHKSMDLIEIARQYVKAIYWKAPELVVHKMSRYLAEELVRYQHEVERKTNGH